MPVSQLAVAAMGGDISGEEFTAAALREHAERYLNHEFDCLDQGSGTMDSHLLARFWFFLTYN